MSAPPPLVPGPTDHAVHQVVLEAFRSWGPVGGRVGFEHVPAGRVWMTSIEAPPPGAARLAVWNEGPADAEGHDVEFGLTVARTHLEVRGLSDPWTWLRQVVDAVLAGRVVETGFGDLTRVRIETAGGPVEGGAFLVPGLRRLLPRRDFLPYARSAC